MTDLMPGTCSPDTCPANPVEPFLRMAKSVRASVVPEMNLGQMVREVERVAGGHARTIAVTHAGGGVHQPEDILNAILEAAQ